MTKLDAGLSWSDGGRSKLPIYDESSRGGMAIMNDTVFFMMFCWPNKKRQKNIFRHFDDLQFYNKKSF